MIPKLKLYVTNIKPKPTVASFETVKEAVNDQLLEAKLEFFKFVATHMEPFLRKFQCNKQMVSFLYEA